MIDDLLDNVKADGMFLAPSVLEDLSQSETSLERLRKVKFVEFGGGKLLESFPLIALTWNKDLSLDVLEIRS